MINRKGLEKITAKEVAEMINSRKLYDTEKSSQSFFWFVTTIVFLSSSFFGLMVLLYSESENFNKFQFSIDLFSLDQVEQIKRLQEESKVNRSEE